MSNFYRVDSSISALNSSKRAFDEKINILNTVKTNIYSTWKTGDDRDRAIQAIDVIQDRCRYGKNICENAVDEARRALQAATAEKQRREQEARRAEAERQRKLAEQRREQERARRARG